MCLPLRHRYRTRNDSASHGTRRRARWRDSLSSASSARSTPSSSVRHLNKKNLIPQHTRVHADTHTWVWHADLCQVQMGQRQDTHDIAWHRMASHGLMQHRRDRHQHLSSQMSSVLYRSSSSVINKRCHSSTGCCCAGAAAEALVSSNDELRLPNARFCHRRSIQSLFGISVITRRF